jgi:uncharacterized membrane protein
MRGKFQPGAVGPALSRLLLFLLLCVGLAVPALASAQSETPGPALPAVTPTASARDQANETLEARVISATVPGPCTPATPAEEQSGAPVGTRCQRVDLLFTSGSLSGQSVTVEEGRVPVASRANVTYRAGDRVLVDRNINEGQPDAFYIVDFVRTDGLLMLAIAFAALAIIFGRLRGVSSLAGLAVSFAILMLFVLPRIVAGDDPVLISVVGAVLIMVVTLYLSHGFSVKTTAAIAGTSIALLITGLLAWLVVDGLRLTGLGSDEAFYVQIAQGNVVSVRGLLIGGIIIGSLGVLDDLTISQSAVVFELRNVDPTMTARRLFTHAINIGRDHIAATVNTLVLAYAGASLPLLVLFTTFPDTWGRIFNQEVVAEEVVRTLVGSIGLIASVPITTWIAASWAIRRPPKAPSEGHEGHIHVHGHSH